MYTMRKILSLIVTVIAFTGISNAQTEKGTSYLGLNIGYSSRNEKHTLNYQNYTSGQVEKTDNKGFLIGPSFSRFIADKLELGVAAAYGYSKMETDRDVPEHTTQNQYLGSLFMRKHVMFTDQFGLRTGPSFSFSYAKSETDVSPGENETMQYTGGLVLDLEYFPLKRLGIAANIGGLYYESSKTRTNNKEVIRRTNTFDFSFTNSLNLSVFWILGKK